MISQGEFLRLQTSDPGNPQYTVQPGTTKPVLNPERAQTTQGGKMVVSDAGDILSQEGLSARLANEENYNKQLQNTLSTISPYFDGDQQMQSIFVQVPLLAGDLTKSTVGAFGLMRESVKMLPSTLLSKAADDTFSNKLHQMGQEKANAFLETLQAYGFNRFTDAINFGNKETADKVLDRITKETGRVFDEQERETFRAWADFQQKQKIEILKGQALNNWQTAWKNDNGPWHNKTTSAFSKLTGIFDAASQVTILAAASLIPAVGPTLAAGAMGSQIFYDKRIEAYEKGWDIDKANGYAGVQALAQMALEYFLPARGAVKGFYSSKRSIGNTLANYVAPEAIEEASQQLFEDTLDRITGLEYNTALRIVKNAAVAGLIGGIAGGLPGVAFAGKGQAYERFTALEMQEEKVQKVEQAAEKAKEEAALNQQELQQKAEFARENWEKDAKNALVEELQVAYPNASKEDISKLVDVGFQTIKDPNVAGQITKTLYNYAGNVLAKLNSEDPLSLGYKAQFAAFFEDNQINPKQRQGVENAIKTIYDKKLTNNFVQALTEVEMGFRNFLTQQGYSNDFVDKWCANVLRPNIMDLALQAGITPSQLMKVLQPQILKLERAKYNKQKIGFQDELFFMSPKTALGIDAARQEANSSLDTLVKIQGMNNAAEKKAASEELHDMLFRQGSSHGQDMNLVFVALRNNANNLKRICEDAGIMPALRDQEYMIATLLMNQGYSIEEVAKSFGDYDEKINEKYNKSVEKLFPPLSTEELEQVNNLFDEASDRGFENVMLGSYSRKSGAITISTQAPSSTLVHELTHHIMYTAINTQYTLKEKMGIDLNTPITRYLRKTREAMEKETGVAPSIDQALDFYARKIEEFYSKGRKASSDSETVELYDAIANAEYNAIKEAQYTYEDLESATKKDINKAVKTLMKEGNRPSLNMIIASSEFSQDLMNLDKAQLSERIGNFLNAEKKAPIRNHDDLLSRYNKILKENSALQQLELLDLALDVSNSLSATAAMKYAQEQDEALYSSSQDISKMPYDGTDAVFSLAGTVTLKLDNMRSSYNQKMFKDFWDEKKLALSDSSLAKGIDVSATIDKLIESKQFMKRFIYSPYAYLKGTDLFVARRVRELTYQMQKKVNKAQESVRDFYMLLREGMRKNNVTNAMYHANYMHPYLNCTAEGYEAARNFVEKYAGKKGLKAFDDMNAQFKQFAKDLKASGALRTAVEHFAPRHISDFPRFLEHLRREPQHELYNLVAEMEKAGKSSADIADAVNAVFYNKQDWEKNKVTSLNRRKVLAIRREDLMYYDDPFDAALKYFEDAGRTVVTRQMFGFHQEIMDDPSKLERKEALINLRETAKEKVLDNMLLDKTNELFKEIDSIDTVEGWLDFAKKKGFKSDLNKNSTLEELYKEKLEYEEEVSKEEMQNLRDNPEVQVRADEEVDQILKEQKRIFENTDAQYGIVGKILQERIDSGKLNKQQINDIVYALRSVNVRQHAGMPLAQWLRQLNSLTVIGASIASPFTNLREMKLTAARWGYHSTLYGFNRAVRAVLGARTGKLSDWMEKIGLPPMNEFIRPQDEKMLTKAVNFAYKWTGFSTLDQVAKLTNAFAAEKSMAEALRKGNTDSAQYKKTMEFINRTFAVDLAFDADGHYKRRYEQVIGDLKNGNITEDVKFLMYNAVSDQQPINALEVPVQYNYAGPFGQLCYQFQTVSMKQFEFVTSDIIETAKTDRNLALQKLAVLAMYAVALGVPEQWLEELLKGRRPGNVLPEAFYAVADYAMISPYFISQVKDKGLFEAYVSSYTPSANIFTNMWKDATQIVFGSKKLKNARTVMNIPIIGQLLYNWFGGGAAWSKRQGIYIGDLDDYLDSFDAKEFFLGDWD